jgi:hypothetical protein
MSPYQQLERVPIVRGTTSTTTHPKGRSYHRIQRDFFTKGLSSKVECRHDLLNRAVLLSIGYTIVFCNSRSGTNEFRRLPEVGR